MGAKSPKSNHKKSAAKKAKTSGTGKKKK